MRKWSQWLVACGLIGVGYLLGSSGVAGTVRAWAQDDKAEAPAAAVQPGAVSDDAQKKITAAFEALKAAREALEADSRYTSATSTMNVFGILSGGLNAVEDLESGRGVDPETFAALYADLGSEPVKTKLTKDDKGRLVYNGKLIQMYPISRLRKTFDARGALSGEKLAPETKKTDKTEKTDKPAEKEEKADKAAEKEEK